MTLFDSIRRMIRQRRIRKEVATLRNITLGEIMTKYVVTIRQEDDVIKAATKMIAEDISCLVVTEGEKPIGVLTERDFLWKVPLTGAAFNMKVKDIMTPNPVTVLPTMKLPEAVALMKQHHFRRLIVAVNGKLMGIVTQTDFTKTLKNVMTSYPVFQELQIGNVMTKSVLTITSKQTVSQAKERMLKANIGCILIVDKGVVEGIFTEYDVVMQFYDQHGKLEMDDISKYMRKYVRAMSPQTNIFEANRLMLEKNMRRLLVVDGTKIVGILTQTDVCRFVYTALDIIEKAAQNPQIPLKRFSLDSEIHGEFRGEHLKAYSVE